MSGHASGAEDARRPRSRRTGPRGREDGVSCGRPWRSSRISRSARDRVLLHRRVDLVAAELRPLEQRRQPADRVAARGEAEQDAAQVLDRRLALPSLEAVPRASTAFHPRVRGDHGATRVGLGLEVVDRVADRRGERRRRRSSGRRTRSGAVPCGGAAQRTTNRRRRRRAGRRRPRARSTGTWAGTWLQRRARGARLARVRRARARQVEC